MPVAVVDDRAGLGGGVAQVLRQDRQRADQRGAVGHPERAAVEVGEQPLVRVGAVGVGELDAVVDPAELGRDRGDAGPGGVDVQPGAVLVRDLAELADRVDRAGAGRADRRDDQRRA